MALTPRPSSTQLKQPRATGPDETVAAGRLLAMMPGSHSRLIAPTGELLSLNCTLKISKIEEMLGYTIRGEGSDAFLELTGSHAEIEWLMNRILQELRHSRMGSDIAIEAYANALCVELARRLREIPPEEQRATTGGLAPWRMRVIQERCRLDAPAPTIPELAELCAMTVRHLSRAFKEESGKTLGQYIQETTIERASRLLCESDKPISHIAQELGFSSTSSFSQAFKRATGQLPSAARKERA